MFRFLTKSLKILLRFQRALLSFSLELSLIIVYNNSRAKKGIEL